MPPAPSVDDAGGGGHVWNTGNHSPKKQMGGGGFTHAPGASRSGTFPPKVRYSDEFSLSINICQ